MESAACEAVKKGSGYDLQILSQRTTKTRKYTIIDAESGASMENQKISGGEEYFVSHDLPTCVRNSLEGNNLIMMYAYDRIALSFKLQPSTPKTMTENINDIMKYTKSAKFHTIMRSLGLITESQESDYIENFITKFGDIVRIYNGKLNDLCIGITTDIKNSFDDFERNPKFSLYKNF